MSRIMSIWRSQSKWISFSQYWIWLTHFSSLMKLVQHRKTKHLHEKKRWKNCVRFFCHDSRNVQSIARIRILDCNVEFYLYQTFEMFVMLKMKLFQNEKYNVDDMKLKKISSFVIQCDSIFDEKTNIRDAWRHRSKSNSTEISQWSRESSSKTNVIEAFAQRNRKWVSNQEFSLFFHE